MSASKLRREALARGERDPGPDRATARLVRIIERDGRKFVRIYGKEHEIDGHGLRHGDRVVLRMGGKL